MAPASLSSLPRDLVLLLLTYARSPRDLYALIRTSKRNYEVFDAYNVLVLEAVARNVIPREVLPAAVAACRASDLTVMWYQGCSVEELESRQDAFLDDFGKQSPDEPLARRQRSLPRLLCQLWWTTEGFVTEFQELALFCANSRLYKRYPAPRRDRNISSIERSRIQRAFFWFECFRRLYPLRERDWAKMSWPPQKPREVRFLPCLNAWEREEFASIWQFLLSKASKTCRTLQEEIFRTKTDLSPGAHSCQDKKNEAANARKREDYNSLLIPAVYRDNLIVYWKLDYIARRGLRFLRWISELPPCDALYVLLHSCGLFRPYSKCPYPPVFPAMWRERPSEDNELSRVEYGLKDDLAGPNEGWKWERKAALRGLWRYQFSEAALREMGFVFWDADRMRKVWKIPSAGPNAAAEESPGPGIGGTLAPTMMGDGEHADFGVYSRLLSLPVRYDLLEPDSVCFSNSGKLKSMLQFGFPEPFGKEESSLFQMKQ